METNDEKKARVTFEQPENLTNKYETGEGWLTRKPEAAGQEQETQESMLSEIIENFQEYLQDVGSGENVRPLDHFFREELDKFTITRKKP